MSQQAFNAQGLYCHDNRKKERNIGKGNSNKAPSLSFISIVEFNLSFFTIVKIRGPKHHGPKSMGTVRSAGRTSSNWPKRQPVMNDTEVTAVASLRPLLKSIPREGTWSHSVSSLFPRPRWSKVCSSMNKGLWLASTTWHCTHLQRMGTVVCP